MLENNDKLNCDTKVPESKILISEYENSCNYVNLLVVKAKEKNNKQQLLKRLIFGLEPTLRTAVMKALVAKRKKLLLSDLNVDDFEGLHIHKYYLQLDIRKAIRIFFILFFKWHRGRNLFRDDSVRENCNLLIS